jgi:hypothetical protein
MNAPLHAEISPGAAIFVVKLGTLSLFYLHIHLRCEETDFVHHLSSEMSLAVVFGQLNPNRVILLCHIPAYTGLSGLCMLLSES